MLNYVLKGLLAIEKLNQIRQIIADCEGVQEDRGESEYSKQQEKIIACNNIAEVLSDRKREERNMPKETFESRWIPVERLPKGVDNQHICALEKQAYEQGLNDAWKAARKVFDIWFKTCHHSPNEFNIFWELDGITGDDILDLFFKRYSVPEVIEKLREMEDNG